MKIIAHEFLFCLVGHEEAFEVFNFEGYLPIPRKGEKVELDEGVFIIEDVLYQYERKKCMVGIYVRPLQTQEEDGREDTTADLVGEDSQQVEEDSEKREPEAEEAEVSEGDVSSV